jgi:hypothetical protein
MAKYKLKEFNVLNQETGTYVPYDEGNRHYIEYLEWVAEGNKPDPFETPEEQQVRIEKELLMEIETKIQNKMREIAIKELQAKGEIDINYKGIN